MITIHSKKGNLDSTIQWTTFVCVQNDRARTRCSNSPMYGMHSEQSIVSDAWALVLLVLDQMLIHHCIKPSAHRRQQATTNFHWLVRTWPNHWRRRRTGQSKLFPFILPAWNVGVLSFLRLGLVVVRALITAVKCPVAPAEWRATGFVLNTLTATQAEATIVIECHSKWSCTVIAGKWSNSNWSWCGCGP